METKNINSRPLSSNCTSAYASYCSRNWTGVCLLQIYTQNSVCISLLHHSYHIAHKSHPPWHQQNYNWWWVQIMELLSMQFSPVSQQSHTLSPNTFLSTLFSHTLTTRYITNNCTHTYIHNNSYSTLLYILRFMFLIGTQNIPNCMELGCPIH